VVSTEKGRLGNPSETAASHRIVLAMAGYAFANRLTVLFADSANGAIGCFASPARTKAAFPPATKQPDGQITKSLDLSPNIHPAMGRVPG
jgi:hypothetical protein